ncbi:MAG: 3-phosphoshikimate 1-carboxyvinyltransferase [Lachnospiraceae bacterium]|nr:3-phosphoshikimate 1-carboxyvinyltransferase [Lachnospiraceae bacterium]
MEKYVVKKLENKKSITVDVPGSKSITNRALLLAAMGTKKCRLRGVLFSEDSRAFLSCIKELGFDLTIDEKNKTVEVQGTGGKIKNNTATINVMSAGTAARFLTVFLAVAGGDYVLNSSEQMKRRPMAELIDALRNLGVDIKCLESEGHFPFELHSEGLKKSEVTIDTTRSSQYASALMMAAAISDGMTITMTGDRTEGAYIKITSTMMKQFGVSFEKNGNVCTVKPDAFGIEEYLIEPDASAACYFYAMAPVLKIKTKVNNLFFNSMQGDMKFVRVMEKIGCRVTETENGIEIDGTQLKDYNGVDVVMKDFSDQTMTMAVVAAFAKTKTIIRNIGHIRLQESDRVSAIANELTKMGCKVEILEDNGQTDICIEPGTIVPCEIDTYEDHRMAMSFTIPGLAVDGFIINNPLCCRKTFENYYDIIDEITK